MQKQKKDIFYKYKKEIHPADDIRLVHSGLDYFNTLEKTINNTQHTLHFQTYIFDGDETGLKIALALQSAAKRGVNVFVVLDGFGSKKLSKKIINDMIDAGVKFRFFSPFFSFQNIYIGRRLHHKVIVSDAKIALIGGINIANKYKGDLLKEPWLDYAILIKGNVCENAQRVCEQICRKQFRVKFKYANKEKEQPAKNNKLISFSQNDKLRKKNQICSNYVYNIRNSKKTVIIVASYFLPGRKLRKSLEIAAKNGVKIKIILSGISDIRMFRKATVYLYTYLHKNNIEIYEWKKSILHGKLAVIDQYWTTVGSFNLNHLSSHASIELNVEVFNRDFAKKIEEHLFEIIQNGCNKIEHNTGFNLKEKILGAVSYFVVRTAVKILALFPNIKYLYTRIND